jgi:nucleoredoxin
MNIRYIRFFCGLLCLQSLAAELPLEVTVTKATKLEIVAQGKSSGSVGLRVGERLEVTGLTGKLLNVRYRNLTGRVPAAHTDLPDPTAEPDNAGPKAPEPVPTTKVSVSPDQTPAAIAHSPAPYQPTGTIDRALDKKLVAFQNGVISPYEPGRLAGIKFFGIYYSASWCGPCRSFTPNLVDAYGKIRSLYPEFEIVHVNLDKSAAEMAAYMRDDHMPWPALTWKALRQTPEIERYAGGGIPCLVLIDENGKVLSDTYRWGRYVGPDAVIDDTWKILRDFRRSHPRPKL